MIMIIIIMIMIIIIIIISAKIGRNKSKRQGGTNKYKLTELSPTTNQTLESVIMKREHVC